jgi:predicted regulator of Ras-like GTPase activity (Roadblock/LC7/MglB family)
MTTGFTQILQDLVERTPGAQAAIFAARDGEAVDQFAPDVSVDDVRLWGAHYGVLLSQMQRCLHLFHFGEAEEIFLKHDRLDVLLRPVAEGYFLCFTLKPGAHLATALRELGLGAERLRHEM